MSEITFKFNLHKLVNALGFFATSGIGDLTKLKAAKLLYFADKEHLLRYGRPILGDVYSCMPYGPVPSVALNQMNDAINAPEVADEAMDVFQAVLKTHRPLFSKHPIFQAKKHYDESVFSSSELGILKEISGKYGALTASQLVTLTHEEPTWKIPNRERLPQSSAPIPYELFFAGASEQAQEVLRVLRSEQEETRELDALLNFGGR